MGPSAVHIDESRWPIVFVVWPRATTLADLDGYFEVRARWLARHERFAIVIDASAVDGFDADLRRRVAELSTLQCEEARRWIAGEGVVLRSLSQRALLVALEWLFPPAYPRRTFGSLSDAIEWAEAQLSREQGELARQA